MRGARFRYWAFNTKGRRSDVIKKRVFLDRSPGAADIGLSDIAKADTQSIVRKMIAYTSGIPATLGEATQARRRLGMSVGRIAWGTYRMGDSEESRGDTFPLHDSQGARL